MRLTEKQSAILSYLKVNSAISKQEAVRIIGKSYYCNADKHVGDVLSRMVKSGLLIREKRGQYKPGKLKQPIEIKNQLSLL